MKPVSAHTLAVVVQGEVLGTYSNKTTVTSVSTDTRSINDSAVFFTLKGENFDAHDFLPQAAKKAVIIVAERIEEELLNLNCVFIKVEDSLRALQNFASWYRKDVGARVIGLTGSNGKTSTKDFLLSVLKQKYVVGGTVGNFNNGIGLPLSILNLQGNEQVCVLEMGMNHTGEIEALCKIAQPEHGVITNVGVAHIEFLGSQDSIAHEKGALARSLPATGTLAISSSCTYREKYQKESAAQIVVTGKGDIKAENIQFLEEGSSFVLSIRGMKAQVCLPVLGSHMIDNALLAAAIGDVMGLDVSQIAKGLGDTRITGGRLTLKKVKGIVIIDDTYNANPDSMKAASQTLADMPSMGKKILILGEMGELGDYATRGYQEVAQKSFNDGHLVLTLGVGNKEVEEMVKKLGGNAYHFSKKESLVQWLKENCISGDCILFKGSRASAMEEIIQETFR